MDWYDYLDQRFALDKAAIRDRDRVVTVCPSCKDTNVVLVTNLKTRIRKHGAYECRSCSSRKATLKARDKWRRTMMDRYGVDNPMRSDTLKERFVKSRKGEGGS